MDVRRNWIAGIVAALAGIAGAQQTVRLSVDDQGFEADSSSYVSSVSEDGRFVAFSSTATNLAPTGGGAVSNVFTKDRATDEVRLLSRSYTTGGAGGASSGNPSISADGRYVCFFSHATDLVPNDTNQFADVFRADAQTGEVVRVSVSSAGVEGNSPSDGSSISADGRYVAFESDATNLVSGDSNGVRDVFVHDVTTGVTEIVSVATGGSQVNGTSRAPSISSSGRYVVFESSATNAILGDTNGYTDVFLRDRLAGTTRCVSLTSTGAQLNGNSFYPRISGDGRFVVFTSDAQVFVHDVNSGLDVLLRDVGAGSLFGVSHAFGTHLVSANKPSYKPQISSDGRWIVFLTDAANIVGGDTNGTRDAFRFDRLTGERIRMSVSSSGSQSSGGCGQANVTLDGQVVFTSTGADLVAGDSGSYTDVFVRNLGPAFPELYCSGKTSSQGCTPYLAFAGTPSATSATAFSVQGHDFLPGESGFLIYGVNGKSNLDFHGGKLCVKLPFSRWLPFKQAKNVGGGACGGALQRNFNARIQSGADPQLTAGQVVHAQWLQRDPGDPAGFGDGLSNGLRFTIGS